VTSWFVYIVRCADDTLYTGITTGPARRMQEHNAGGPKGARYTHPRRPVSLVYVERARMIKKLDRERKLALCTCPISAALLASSP
jgi:putative endonuclease